MVREQNGRPIFWNGHLCEGDRMHYLDESTFLLWTRCKLHDVPPAHARELEPRDHITCPVCRQLLH